MILAVDVDYRQTGGAVAAGVLISHWASEAIVGTLVRYLPQVEPYRTGRFFERELPCILAVMNGIAECPEAIIIDGYVVLGKERHEGLGAYLFRALNGRVPVVGVGKTRFRDTPDNTEIRRGASLRPLYVTSMGMDEDVARAHVQSMHGVHRIPTILAAVDRLCRTAEPSGSPD